MKQQPCYQPAYAFIVKEAQFLLMWKPLCRWQWVGKCSVVSHWVSSYTDLSQLIYAHFLRSSPFLLCYQPQYKRQDTLTLLSRPNRHLACKHFQAEQKNTVKKKHCISGYTLPFNIKKCEKNTYSFNKIEQIRFQMIQLIEILNKYFIMCKSSLKLMIKMTHGWIRTKWFSWLSALYCGMT